MHVWVATWKFPFELCSVESPPRTTSYVVAPDTVVHERSTLLPPALVTVRANEPAGTARRQPLATRYGLGPVDENVIQPAFSDQARPLKIPLIGLMVTPAPEGAKLIQPAFSDHA